MNVLVTGAASGIGAATMRILHDEGAHVRGWDLQTAANVDVVDVTDASDVDEAVRQLLIQWGQIDAVIHCAGVARVGQVSDINPTDHQHIVAVNLGGTVLVSRAVLAPLKLSRGSLVLVSSVSGFHGIPEYATYGATKAGVINFAQALRVETAGDGVHIAVICTHFTRSPLLDESVGARAFERPHPLIEVLAADVVARAIVRGIRQRRFYIWTGWRPRVIFWLSRYADWLSYYAILRVWQAPE